MGKQKKDVSNSGLDNLLDFEKQIGAKSTSAFKNKKADINIISTGSPLLDDITVVGGLPRGRIVQFYGPFGGGKTFLGMLAAKNALISDPTAIVCWFDAENTFDYDWAENIGIWKSSDVYENPDTGEIVNKNRLRIYDFNDGKRIFKTITGEKRISPQGKVSKTFGLLDLTLEKKINCALIVIDSLAAIIPPGEDTSFIGKQNMALLSRFLPIEFRRMSGPLMDSNVCLLCINQVTTNINDPYADKFSFSGGEKLRHWLSLNIFVDKINQKEGKILLEKDKVDTLIGQQIKLVVKKSKFGPYPRSCKSKVCFVAGKEHTGKEYDVGIVDIEKEWVELGVHYGIISKSGAWFTFNDERFCGIDNFSAALKENKDLLQLLISKTKEEKQKNPKNNAYINEEDLDDDDEEIETEENFA
jgi:recombination protein RecA